nr:hypothetical protein [Tanacetum cinerariifolium]
MEVVEGMWRKGVNPDVVTYGTLISGLAKKGEMGRASEVFDEMCEKGMNPDVMSGEVWEDLVVSREVYPDVGSYNVMISGLCKCGKVKESLEVWERMKRNDREMDLFTYSSVINVFCESGNVEGGMMVFNEMIGKRVCPDVAVYNVLLNGCFRGGMVSECFELWERMEKDDCRDVYCRFD